jgi:lysylphosphatidylglycerol synthetase-like protein (DUF2156 family)
MRRQGSPPGLLFRLIVPATAIFIITIFALLAAPFSDQQAPIWEMLEKSGDRLLLAEFVVIIVLAVFAMAWDRRQIVKAATASAEADAAEARGTTTAAPREDRTPPLQSTDLPDAAASESDSST